MVMTIPSIPGIWRQKEMSDDRKEQNLGHRSAMDLDTPPDQGKGK